MLSWFGLDFHFYAIITWSNIFIDLCMLRRTPPQYGAIRSPDGSTGNEDPLGLNQYVERHRGDSARQIFKKIGYCAFFTRCGILILWGAFIIFKGRGGAPGLGCW